MVGTGTSATAVVGIVTGAIRTIVISNRGGGYIGGPRVAISSAPSSGITGIATVRFISGIAAQDGGSANPGSKSIQHVDLENAGAGYASTDPPDILFYGGGGAGAAATAIVNNDAIGIVTITGGGSGYTTTPTITFTNEIFKTGAAVTVSAAATAVVSSAGTITAINITNAGAGYSIAPTVSVGMPPIGNSGDFIFNETVTGGTSGTTARVRTWNSSTYVIELASVDGTWTLGETLTGSTSGATRAIRLIDLDPTEDGYADNYNIEVEADAILDFTEQNPFGTP